MSPPHSSTRNARTYACTRSYPSISFPYCVCISIGTARRLAGLSHVLTLRMSRRCIMRVSLKSLWPQYLITRNLPMLRLAFAWVAATCCYLLKALSWPSTEGSVSSVDPYGPLSLASAWSLRMWFGIPVSRTFRWLLWVARSVNAASH